MLDLRGMNKIISVDAELCTALVEPGVTYRQIVDYINGNKLDLWMSFPASNKLGGPVGNTLDRGVGFNRNGEHIANFCGLEVVTANGDVIRTGLGGVGEGQAWQSYRWGFGPWVDGIFSQSNLGVVTKMGLWLMKKPEKSVLLMATWEDEEAFAAGCVAGTALKRDGTFDAGVNAGDSWYGIAQTLKRSDLYQGKDAIPGRRSRQVPQGEQSSSLRPKHECVRHRRGGSGQAHARKAGAGGHGSDVHQRRAPRWQRRGRACKAARHRCTGR